MFIGRNAGAGRQTIAFAWIGIAAILSTVAFATSAMAQREIMPPPHPIIQRDLTLTDMRVDIDIKGGVANTTIRQTLRNDGGGMAEGKYMLPLPPGATVSSFKLIDGDTVLEGEVLDAGEARRIYQDIVRTMRDPGLLEYQDTNTFSVSAFPFNAGQSRTIEVSFNHTLSGTTDLVQYNLPLRWAGWSRCANTQFVLTYDIDSNYDLGTINSPTHGVSANRDGNRRASGSYEATVSDFASDFTLNIGRRTSEFAASVMCFPGDGGEDGYFILSLLAALPDDDEYVPKDVLFIFDKSGSMSGDKIVQAKGALKFVLDKLKRDDRFGLIYYSDNVDKVFSGMRDATSDNIDEARRFVDKLEADGGTDINTALGEGARMLNPDGRPTYVIFLTDGLPTVGDTDVDHIINNAKEAFDRNVKLFVFGVGYDVNTTLLDSLSYNHHGSASYVSPDEDIEVKVSQFYAKMSSPALVNLDVELSGIDEYDTMPKELPDLFHNTEVFITGRYRGTPSRDIGVVVMGDTDDGRQKMSATVDANVSSTNHQIPRLWASRKVSYLLDQVRLHGDNQELLNEIDRLAMRFGIVTPYTSYLITEPGYYFDEGQRRAGLDDMMMEAREEESGMGAVQRSKMNQANQAADVAAAPQTAGDTAGGSGDRAYLKESPTWSGYYSDSDEHKKGSADPYSAVNYVNNQTFVRQEAQWVDARYEKDRQDVIQVTTYGDEYFDLINDYPELGEYLSQGEEVVLVVADDLVLQTVLDEVSNSSADLDRLRNAVEKGEYISDTENDRVAMATEEEGTGHITGATLLTGAGVAMVASVLLVMANRREQNLA